MVRSSPPFFVLPPFQLISSFYSFSNSGFMLRFLFSFFFSLLVRQGTLSPGGAGEAPRGGCGCCQVPVLPDEALPRKTLPPHLLVIVRVLTHPPSFSRTMPSSWTVSSTAPTCSPSSGPACSPPSTTMSSVSVALSTSPPPVGSN